MFPCVWIGCALTALAGCSSSNEDGAQQATDDRQNADAATTLLVAPEQGGEADSGATAIAQTALPTETAALSTAVPIPIGTVAAPPLDGGAPLGPLEDEGNVVIEEEEDVLIEQGESAACERQIEFSGVALSEPPPFDVVIVADHSDSLSWSRDELASGLSTLLDGVQGRDVRFFVLTPTQYGASSAAISMATGTDLVAWRDPVTQEPYSNEMTRYTALCKDADGAPMTCPEYPPPAGVAFSLEGHFELQMPPPVAAISKDLTPEQVAVQQQAIVDGILELGTGGSPYEQPLCTLVRYINQAPEQLPERAVFIVISDEDDDTNPLDCLSGVNYESYYEEAVTTGCEPNCDFVTYSVETAGVQSEVTFTCMPYDDFGNPQPDAAQQKTAYYNPQNSCEGVPTGVCTAEDEADVLGHCDAGMRIEDCQRSCVPSDTPIHCTVDVADVSINGCEAPFDIQGASYASVADYCTRVRGLDGWSNCTGVGYGYTQGVGSLHGSQTPTRLVWGLVAADLVREFETKATDVFGRDNHFVEVVGFMPEFECQPMVGQSYATNLAELASSAEDVFPICESYAPALGRIQSYATGLLQTEYFFELGPRETLEAIYVTDLVGSERQLGPADYEYDFDQSRLTLKPDAISSRDRSLRVELLIHCTAVVR